MSDDLSKLSDADLMALLNKTAPSAPASDVSKLSDKDLLAALAKPAEPAAAGSPSVAADVASEGGKGLARGLAGAAGDIGQAVMGPFGPGQHFANLMADLGLGERPTPQPSYGEQLVKATGIEPTPQTPYGRYAGTVGEFVGNPESYLGPGSILAKGATATGSALGSQALGDVATQFGIAPNSPKAQQIAQMVGAIAGGHVASRLPGISVPTTVSPQRQAMVDTLDREGIPSTAGDRTGGTQLKAIESELSPGTNEKQRDAFIQAGFNRVGETVGDRPIKGENGVVDTMMKRTGAAFDTLTGRNNMVVDPQFNSDLTSVHKTYNDVPGLYPKDTVDSVNGALGRVQAAVQNGGMLSGPEYQTLRSNLRAAAQGATDPQRAAGLHDVTNALDDAMERSIQANNPQDAGAFATARRDYRNALVLQRWAGSANMTPATLAQSAKAVYGKNAYVRGQDDFSGLADAGSNIMKQYQDSGTARRLSIEHVLQHGAGLAGFLLGTHQGGAEAGGVPGLLSGEALGGLVARPVARAAVMNPVSQNVLASRPGASPSMIALVNAIRGGQQP